MAENGELTPEDQTLVDRSVDRRLKTLALAFGIPNLLFLAGSFVYIFFYLPEQAGIRAETLLLNRFTALEAAATSEAASAIEKSGRAQLSYEQAQSSAALAQVESEQVLTTIENLNIQAERIQSRIQTLAQTDSSVVSQAVEAINDGGRNILGLQARIDNIEPRLSSMESRILSSMESRIESQLPKGTGACTWIAIGGGHNKTFQCPDRQFLAGIHVNYHGGAWRNWVDRVYCCSLAP